jgi:Na+-driven multidrug efflux pump
MLITGGMVVLNAVLAPFLIYGLGPFPRLEVLGAAIAAVFSQLVAVVAFVWRVVARDPSLLIDRSALRRLDTGLARNLLGIGFPGMAIGSLYSTIYLFMSGIAARMGTLELAILGLANRAEALTYLVSNGFGAATATMVGQNLGARRADRAERAAWLSASWMGLYSLAAGALLIFWPRQVLALFTSDPQVLEMGAPYVRILGYAQPLMSLEIVIEHAFSGAGNTVPPMIISVPVNALRIPLILWVVHELHAGLLGIAWVLAITCMLRGVLAAAWFRRGGWKRRRL